MNDFTGGMSADNFVGIRLGYAVDATGQLWH